MPTCDGCRFWVRVDDEDGICRRYAPKPIRMKDEYEYRPAFPLMAEQEACGEHQPKEPTP